MTDDQTTLRAALQIGRDYIHDALAEHDAKYARGYNMPTEIARAGIEADLASIDAALALLDAEPRPSVPMAMLSECGTFDVSAIGNPKIKTSVDYFNAYREIAARYGYTVTESGKEEGR